MPPKKSSLLTQRAASLVNQFRGLDRLTGHSPNSIRQRRQNESRKLVEQGLLRVVEKNGSPVLHLTPLGRLSLLELSGAALGWYQLDRRAQNNWRDRLIQLSLAHLREESKKTGSRVTLRKGPFFVSGEPRFPAHAVVTLLEQRLDVLRGTQDALESHLQNHSSDLAARASLQRVLNLRTIYVEVLGQLEPNN